MPPSPSSTDDHSRVVLSLQDNTPGSDYINASFVDVNPQSHNHIFSLIARLHISHTLTYHTSSQGFNKPNEYIASQGPIPSTFSDFWRMVWEMDSPTIVMVTNLKEEDKVNYSAHFTGLLSEPLTRVRSVHFYS